VAVLRAALRVGREYTRDLDDVADLHDARAVGPAVRLNEAGVRPAGREERTARVRGEQWCAALRARGERHDVLIAIPVEAREVLRDEATAHVLADLRLGVEETLDAVH